ncbi:MAG: helix-turn-helix domain-containing protein, partial [Nanoarchaeota archaeon]
MNTHLLYEIGLQKSEVKTYLALLEIGPTTTGPLMSKAQISSSKVYGILQRLMEKGLVSCVIKEKTKWYQAAAPEQLIEYLIEKEKMVEKQKQEMNMLLPFLRKKQKEKNKQEVQMYSGWKGMMTAFTDFLTELEEHGEYIGFAQTEGEEKSKEVKQFFAKYQKKREEKKLDIRLLAPTSQKRIFTAAPYKHAKRFIVKYVNTSPPSIIIGKERILLSTFEEEPIAVIVSSKAIASAYRSYFELLW